MANLLLQGQRFYNSLLTWDNSGFNLCRKVQLRWMAWGTLTLSPNQTIWGHLHTGESVSWAAHDRWRHAPQYSKEWNKVHLVEEFMSYLVIFTDWFIGHEESSLNVLMQSQTFRYVSCRLDRGEALLSVTMLDLYYSMKSMTSSSTQCSGYRVEKFNLSCSAALSPLVIVHYSLINEGHIYV